MICALTSCLRGRTRLLLYAFFLFLVVWSVPDVSAKQRLIDSQGRDFWFTFLPNFHNYKLGQTQGPDFLYVFVTAQEPTNGVVTYTDRSRQVHRETFSIVDPTQIYTLRLSNEVAELVGINDGGFQPNSSIARDDEKAVPYSFHITSEKDVSVYGLSQANTSSDAFLALPTDALGKDYRVLTYNSNDDTPSQFAVVAVEDNTVITISPTTPTFRYGTTTQTVTLQQGEVYLVQADLRKESSGDLTGTKVEGTKPFGLFAGHQRASIPLGLPPFQTSRDALIEQMPPVDTWGQSVFITPLAQPSTAQGSIGDEFRVLAAYDNTEVSVDGVRVATLRAGAIHEGFANKPMHITASLPILVGQYKETAGPQRIGDPFLMIIPPSEQFLPEYRFINAQVQSKNETPYSEQYITIVAPTSKVGTVQMDGMFVASSWTFLPIGTTGYSYATIKAEDDAHYVKADTGIGIYVYGYGEAISYGYTGGTNFSLVDFQAPRITTATICAGIYGLVFDNASSDSHLDYVEVSAASVVNARVILGTKNSAGDTLAFVADIIDPYTDGSFTIVARDSAGLEMQRHIGIGGFAVQSVLATPANPIPHETFDAAKGKNLCVEYALVNNSAFPQIVTTATFKHSTSGFTIGSTLPIVIPPSSSAVIRLCFSPQKAGSFIDTLLVGNGCVDRAVLSFDVGTSSATVELQVLDARAKPGTVVSIPIKLTKGQNLSESGVQNLRVALHYTSNTLAYRGDALEKQLINKDEHIVVIIPTVHNGDSIVAHLRFFVGLSTDTLTTVHIDSASAVDGRAKVTGKEGVFTTDGICRANGTRLFNPDGRIAVLPARPNPSSSETEVDIETVETGFTRLSVVNVVGQTVKEVYQGSLQPGSHTLIMDVGNLASGVYFLLLQTPTETMMQRMEVQR